MNINQRFSVLFLSVAAACLVAVDCLPGQTTAESLEVTGIWPEAVERAGRCKKNWDEVSPLLLKLEQSIKANDPESIDAKLLGKGHVAVQNIIRDAEVLLQMGETAGVDYMFRAVDAKRIIEKAIELAKMTDAGQKVASQATAYKQKSDSKRTKAIENLRKLLSQKQLEKAETELNELAADIDLFHLWLNVSDAQFVSNQYSQIAKDVRFPINQARAAKTKQLALELIKKQQVKISALIDSAVAAAGEIQSTGKTTIDGQPADGPAAFSKYLKLWQAEHQKVVNCLGWASAIDGQLEPSLQNLMGLSSVPANWAAVDLELQSGMAAALIKIIAADTIQIGAGDLPRVYQQYVQTLGEHANKIGDPKFIAACESALDGLAKKDPAFAARVDNYRKATVDLLDWRNRYAHTAAVNQQATYPKSADLIGTQDCTPELKSGLPTVLPPIKTKVGQTVSATHVIGVNATAAYSGLEGRSWASVKGDLLQQSEVDALAHDLFATTENPPLTVAASTAIKSAMNREYESLGGTVLAFKPEGMSTRFAKLAPVMSGFLTPGQPTGEPAKRNDLILRVDIEPRWLQHKYFFVKLKK